MVQSTIGQLLTDMEREIEAEIRGRAPVHRAPAMAIEHRDGSTEIGKLSAEAVLREYEDAAKEIEAMGTELIDLARRCEAAASDALAVTQELKDTAGRYREEAKRVFLQIENCSLVTAEVRKTCNELKEKIAAPAMIATAPDIKPEPPSDDVV